MRFQMLKVLHKMARAVVVPMLLSAARIITNRPANFVELEFALAVRRVINTFQTATVPA